MIRFVFPLLVSLVSLNVSATDFAGPNVLVPIAGRTPGALGSNWRTDLVITNVSRTKPVEAFVVFVLPDAQEQILQATIEPRASVILKDVVKATFGQETASGMIRVASTDPAALLTARARIYNTGSAQGEYGQTAQGMPMTKLARQAYLPGLSGVDGNRTNVGIANPTERTADVFLSIYQSDGESRGGFSTQIPPHTVRLFNDIFGYFQAGPLDGATLQVTSSEGVYPYASIVRNDTGDADFVTATGVEISSTDVIITPSCTAPAPIRLAVIPSPGWIVGLKEGFDPAQTSAVLAARYGFTVKNVYQFGAFFSEDMSATAIAALRCEMSVSYVEQNGRLPLP